MKLAVDETFDFFQAVRVLERLRALSGAPGPIGGQTPPEVEAVHFRASQSQAFVLSPVVSVQAPDSPDSPTTMEVAVASLTGPDGVLPEHYSADVLARMADGDRNLADFLDLFNNRLIAILYRVWAKYLLPIAVERAEAGGSQDCFRLSLSALAGDDPGSGSTITAGDPESGGFANLFAQAPRTAEALGVLLTDYFDVPCEVEQFVGDWLPLATRDRTQLPWSDRPDGLNCGLGSVREGAVLGRSTWQASGKFRVRIGPLDTTEFLNLMPEGPTFNRLIALTQQFVGPNFAFDVQLVYGGGPARLRTGTPVQGSNALPPVLGRTCWLPRRGAVGDLADLVIHPEREYPNSSGPGGAL